MDLDKIHQIREGQAQSDSQWTSPYVLIGKTSGSFTSAMEEVTGIIMRMNEEDPISFQSGCLGALGKEKCNFKATIRKHSYLP